VEGIRSKGDKDGIGSPSGGGRRKSRGERERGGGGERESDTVGEKRRNAEGCKENREGLSRSALWWG